MIYLFQIKHISRTFNLYKTKFIWYENATRCC